MKFPRSFLFFPLVLFCFIALMASSALAQDWKPLDPADLALKAPVVEKDADAEAIFWEVRVDDSDSYELSLKNYIRIKVFNERGRESQSKVDLPYLGYNKIKDIAARVIKPDGTITELKKDDVFERTIVKLSGLKVKTKSFALAGVEPGSIIEYRWREVRPNGSANHLRLQFQREIPIQTITYYLKPFKGMHYRPFNMGESRFVKDKDGYSRLTMTNMPAFREEARMPPEDNVRSWVFLFYSDFESIAPDIYWALIGTEVYEKLKDQMKTNDDVKAAVAGIIGDATTPEAKLERIYDFCRTKIKNVNRDTTGMTEEEVNKFKENKSAAETLKRGVGTGSNVDLLFAALAKAAGFDARLAFSGNRGDFFFNKSLTNVSFLGSSFIAVRVGDGWQYFSPAELYTPFGMLGWPEEGQDVLITDPKEPIWERTPMAGPEKSLEKRTGKLRLSEDGTLEGDVRIEYTGHLAYDKKVANASDSQAEREKTLIDNVKKRLSTAELSDIHIENVTDPIKPFVYSYHVRVPGYAQRTGKRLFLQPGFIEHGAGALFSTSERRYDIYFHYTWSEQDDFTIELPAGFALDNADAPGDIDPARTQNVCGQKIKMGLSKDEHTLFYKRSFFFGGGNNILFPSQSYAALKTLFDFVEKANNHTITLKQTAATASN
jgi:hypothetical protein